MYSILGAWLGLEGEDRDWDGIDGMGMGMGMGWGG